MNGKTRKFMGYAIVIMMIPFGVNFLDLMTYRNHYVISNSVYNFYAFVFGSLVCICISCFIFLSSKRKFYLFVLLNISGSILLNISILYYGFNYGIYKANNDLQQNDELYQNCVSQIKYNSINFECLDIFLPPLILLVLAPFTVSICYVGFREYYYKYEKT